MAQEMIQVTLDEFLMEVGNILTNAKPVVSGNVEAVIISKDLAQWIIASCNRFVGVVVPTEGTPNGS